jgi:uncharacterized protein (DUF1800 family)
LTEPKTTYLSKKCFNSHWLGVQPSEHRNYFRFSQLSFFRSTGGIVVPKNSNNFALSGWLELRAPFRRLSATILCLLLPVQILPAQQTSNQPEASRVDANTPTPDQRILHLLSRFTFGPTPQEIAAIRALSTSNGTQANRAVDRVIDLWLEQQLNPERIPISSGDRQLATRLAEFPALLLPVDELMGRFPSGAIIRQTANGKLPMPDDPFLFAIYRHHIHNYQEKQAKKEPPENKTEVPNPDMAATTNKMETPTAKPTEAIESSRLAPTDDPTPTGTPRPSYAELVIKTVLSLPPADRVQRILYMQPAEYEQFHTQLKGPQKNQLIQDLNPEQRELLAAYENSTRTVIEELQAQRLLHDIYSSHQLQEVMTTFWLNHFNVYLHKNEETPYYLVSYERDVIRPLALGNFEDLLVATAESPAMLLYLDNSSSTGPDSPAAEKQKERAAQGKAAKATPPGLNENYARELMELHTLGVNGGYTQADVTEVAKVFTGWTVDRPQVGGGFKFDETRHEPGKKLVMGHKIKEHGQKEGLQLLHILATSPATAHFISQELAVAFVSDTPPASLIDRMAKTFLSKHGDIASVLRTMIHSQEFWSAEAYQAKVKTPLEYVVSAARASGADITKTQPLVNALNQMGMPLYACVPPTGYSDKADAWVSTGELVTRMNFALSLATNHLGGIKTEWRSPSQQVTTPSEAEQTLETRLIPNGVSEKTRAAVLEQAQTLPQSPTQAQMSPHPDESLPSTSKPQSTAAQTAAQEKQNAQIAGLLLGSPEFQRR